MEAVDRSSCCQPAHSRREAGLVRAAREDRNVLQDTQVRLQGRGSQATNCDTIDQSDFDLQHRELADLLALHDKPHRF